MKTILIIEDEDYAKEAFKHLTKEAYLRDFKIIYSEGFDIPNDTPNPCELKAILLHNKDNVYGF